MKRFGSCITWAGWVVLTLSACRQECGDDEVIGEAYLTSETKEIVSFTERKTLRYRNAEEDQLVLTRFDNVEVDDSTVFHSIKETCNGDSWVDRSDIGLYAERIVASYQSDWVGIYAEASISSVEQPNPYDTALFDFLSLSVSDRRGNTGQVRIGIATSLRGNVIEEEALNTAALLLTPYRFLPDTTLLNKPMENVYYAFNEENGNEVFLNKETGVAAFRIDGVL